MLVRVLVHLLAAEVRLALFCSAVGVLLGAVTLGPLDVLVMAPATVAAAAVVLAAALVGRRLGLGRADVVGGGQSEDEAAQDDGDDFAERHRVARAPQGNTEG